MEEKEGTKMRLYYDLYGNFSTLESFGNRVVEELKKIKEGYAVGSIPATLNEFNEAFDIMEEKEIGGSLFFIENTEDGIFSYTCKDSCKRCYEMHIKMKNQVFVKNGKINGILFIYEDDKELYSKQLLYRKKRYKTEETVAEAILSELFLGNESEYYGDSEFKIIHFSGEGEIDVFDKESLRRMVDSEYVQELIIYSDYGTLIIEKMTDGYYIDLSSFGEPPFDIAPKSLSRIKTVDLIKYIIQLNIN